MKVLTIRLEESESAGTGSAKIELVEQVYTRTDAYNLLSRVLNGVDKLLAEGGESNV